ncbi:MAG: hypothetical protein MUO77_20965 [Anaerolineales bacterium]|nr:hypothetical protein [Anaerolineales bacterium]
MWWPKLLSKSGKPSREQLNDQSAKATEGGPFDFERTLRELRERKEDIRPSDMALLPEPLRSTLNFAIRIGRVSLTDFANMMKLDISQARQLAELLVVRNLFHVSLLSNSKETFYETRLSAKTRPLGRPANDIWKKLD